MSSNFLEQYQIVKSINGGYLLEHKKTKERAIYKNIISHIYYEDQKMLIERRTSIQKCPQLQKIIHCQISQYKFENNDQFLSNISIIYEDIALRFDTEIENRMKQKIYWTEEEILNTLESAIQALCILHENQLVHGDIRPSSIACDLSGEVKLLDQFATSNHFFKSGGYISPEICKSALKINQEYVLESRNDVFSLGLVFLEATTLISSKDLFQNFSINQELLKMRIQLLNKLGYSQRLVNILSNMLQINGEIRPSIQFIQQIGWANLEVSKSYQFQDISSIPLEEGDNTSHSIILKKVLGDQSTQIPDNSKRNDSDHISVLSKDQQISYNQSVLNESSQQNQDTSLNFQPLSVQQSYQEMIGIQNEHQQSQKQNLNCQDSHNQSNNNPKDFIKQKHYRCRTECEEIKVYTKQSQKSFSKIGEEVDEYDPQKDSETTLGYKRKQFDKSNTSKHQEHSSNEQYENCCPKCVRKMVSPLLRNAFSPRLEAIQDEESIRKSLIKQTPLIRISKEKRELETLEPINFNNFQFNHNQFPPQNRMQQTLDQLYKNQVPPNCQRNIKPPLNTQSQNYLNRNKQAQQKSQQSFQYTSINSNWNRSTNHFTSIGQSSLNESFDKHPQTKSLMNMQNNQFNHRSMSNFKPQSSTQIFNNPQQDQNLRSNSRNNNKLPPSLPNAQYPTQLNQSINMSSIQRKPLFNNNNYNNHPPQNKNNQYNSVPQIKYE